MADPVKISDLPVASSVAAGDILPVVDNALTQTRRCTAAQIAAIGGGRPGDGMVVTASLANGAVTAPKTGFSGPNLIVSRTLTGAGEGTEIPCTAYARGLLATSDSAGALSYLGGLQSATNPTFTGTVTVNGAINGTGVITTSTRFSTPVGSASAPSYTFTGNTNTGLFSPGADNVSIATGGAERLRIDGNGFTQTFRFGTFSAATGNGVVVNSSPAALLPAAAVRVWVNFHGGANSVSPSSYFPAMIRGSFNVSSVTYNGQGDYTVNFSIAMPDNAYAATAMCSRDNYNGFYGMTAEAMWDPGSNGTYSYSTTSLRIRCGVSNPSSAAFNIPVVSVMIAR